MKDIAKKILVVACVILASFGVSSVVQAASFTDEQLETIREACPANRLALEKVQRNDLVARTIRGSSYDSVLKLIRSLNTRLVTNGNNAKDLTDLASELNLNYTQNFYNHYTNYDTAMDKVVNADCNQPELFYSLLQDARAKREQLNGDVLAMQAIIDDYQSDITKLQTNLKATETNQAGE